MSSNYLFHGDSAAAQGKTTAQQDATMTQATDPDYAPAGTSVNQNYQAGIGTVRTASAVGGDDTTLSPADDQYRGS
jgi:hypothetical protein